VKKRFLIFLAFAVALIFIIVSGLNCMSFTIHPVSSIANWLPPTESEFKSYITPECPSVKEALRDIIGEPPYEISQAGFDDIRDWVAINIDYMLDEERWGEDHWQTPEETLSYYTGDCEDFSILLCSLLRAYGIDAERIYVALGIDGEGDGHAFLIEDWNHEGEWQRIEPQAPAQISSWHLWLGPLNPHPDSKLSKYEITAVFNDLYYSNDDESFSQSEEKADFWTPAELLTAVGDIVQRLSQFVGYLLGLLFN
jgi:predicted transglutaminase-like cysteine proteinase